MNEPYLSESSKIFLNEYELGYDMVAPNVLLVIRPLINFGYQRQISWPINLFLSSYCFLSLFAHLYSVSGAINSVKCLSKDFFTFRIISSTHFEVHAPDLPCNYLIQKLRAFSYRPSHHIWTLNSTQPNEMYMITIYQYKFIIESKLSLFSFMLLQCSFSSTLNRSTSSNVFALLSDCELMGNQI